MVDHGFDAVDRCHIGGCVLAQALFGKNRKIRDDQTMVIELKPLVTLLAIVNPLAAVPFFIHYTQNFSRAQRRHTVFISSFSAFMVIAVSALLGLEILSFFGISLASF